MEGTMETIMTHVADLLFWGSTALLVWGAVLTLGQMFAAGKTHGRATAARDDWRRYAPRAH
jgi:hypothetical protein